MKLIYVLARLALRLDRRVMDAEVLLELARHREPNDITIGAGCELDVERGIGVVARDAPEMKVVNAGDTGHDATAARTLASDMPFGTPSSRTWVVSLSSIQVRGSTHRPMATATTGSTQSQPVSMMTTRRR